MFLRKSIGLGVASQLAAFLTIKILIDPNSEDFFEDTLLEINVIESK